MSSQRPAIHPEYLATVAAMARQVGRFIVEVRADAVGGECAGGDAAAGERAFRLRMGPVVAAVRSCRVFNAGRLDRAHPVADARAERWLAAYARRGRTARGSTEIDLRARGVRRDLDFWWWLVRQGKNPLLFARLRDLDLATLFAAADGPTFRTFRYEVPTSAIDCAKRETRRGDVVCLSPVGFDDGLMIRVYAAPDTAAQLARMALELGRMSDEERAASSTLDVCTLRTPEAMTFWGNLVATDPEPPLRSALRRGERYPADPPGALRAIGAAEIVAIMEGRPPGHDGFPLEDVAKWAAEQDALAEETVLLARRAVSAIAADGTATAKRWLSEEGRAAWDAELAGLVRRLDAAGVARRVRASAPNARPTVATHKTPDELCSPERWAAMHFYALRDDALALLEFARGETGARLHAMTSDGGLRELDSSWETGQVLAEAFDGGFDDRRIEDFRERRLGIRLVLWWPSVSPPPVVRERPPEPVDEEQAEFERQLGLERGEEPPLEVVGWGYACLVLRGATERRVLRSAFEYPTGAELRRPRYQAAGPWRAVDWKELRRLVRVMRRQMLGPLACGRAAGSEPTPVLCSAAARVCDGWQLADKYGLGSVKLAPAARPSRVRHPRTSSARRPPAHATARSARARRR